MPESPDPSFGYDLPRLREVAAPEGPADFAAFWRGTRREAEAVPLRLASRRLPDPDGPYAVHEVEFDSLGGFRVGGWLTLPREGEPLHGLVMGHGYGGRSAPAFWPGAATLSPCARGFGRSARPDLPGEAALHVVHGIESREGSILRGCVADLWRAAAALREFLPDWAGPVHCAGTSFGGGLGALAAPWGGFEKVFLQVPTFGNVPLRVTLPCAGSGAAVGRHVAAHPEALGVLAYFDAATAGRHARVPLLIAAALRDPVVPPPVQFSIHNGWAGPKELFVQQTGHMPSLAETRENVAADARAAAWFRDGSGGSSGSGPAILG